MSKIQNFDNEISTFVDIGLTSIKKLRQIMTSYQTFIKKIKFIIELIHIWVSDYVYQ